ncbi:MAG: DUF1822 family protein [Pleurocapsa sp. SU_5_0]|nr:DUF1822 family protein [Pleurocapsa sp. SU_5_0]
MITTNSTIFNATDLVLEIDQATIERVWLLSQTASNPSSRWQNYLNQVALAVFLPWLQAEEDATAKIQWQQEQQDAVWEVVNGTAIAIKNANLVLIPSEADDLEELRVPQEWIDLPNWQADYYLAVQVNVDGGYVRVWSYATHQQLKQGSFNHSDRTYSLTDEELIGDLNALWVARALCPNEATQAVIEPLGELSPVQANNLIERLGNPAQLLPRLVVPFATWSALLQNPSWCLRLAATRRGIATRTPVLQWLKQGLSNLYTEFGWRQIEVTLSAEGAKAATTDAVIPAVGLAKKLAIANQPYELKILPLAEAGAWRFELCCLTPGCMIPAGFKLKLLTCELQDFDGNEDRATQAVPQLALEVDLDPGESLLWQVEPTPDNYQQEILQF